MLISLEITKKIITTNIRMHLNPSFRESGLPQQHKWYVNSVLLSESMNFLTSPTTKIVFKDLKICYLHLYFIILNNPSSVFFLTNVTYLSIYLFISLFKQTLILIFEKSLVLFRCYADSNNCFLYIFFLAPRYFLHII